MKNFTNLVGFSDSKLGYRVAKENLEFIDGKIISKEKISLKRFNSDQFMGGAQNTFWLRIKISEQMEKSREHYNARFRLGQDSVTGNIEIRVGNVVT